MSERATIDYWLNRLHKRLDEQISIDLGAWRERMAVQ